MEFRGGFRSVVQGVVKKCDLKGGVTNGFGQGLYSVIDIDTDNNTFESFTLRRQYL